jgi:endonuclease/exonuclease/phosphatase family metal-dependent hydrolase
MAARVFDIAANPQRSKNIMKFISFNIQFGFGLDGRYSPERIAGALEGADIVALQEVTRNFPKNSQADLPAVFADLMGQYFHVFGAGTDTDAGSAIEGGKVHMRRLQFGNMILSRYPILSTRNILLPRTRTYDKLNLQRSALEAVIATPTGALRVYSVHLDHRDPSERIQQINFIKDRATHYAIEGGAVTGGAEFGFAEIPNADDYVIMGDFNMLPESPEYIAMMGPKDIYYGRTARATGPVDAHAHLGGAGPDAYTWEEPGKPEIRQYLDYCFVSASLAGRVKSAGIDEACIASDHKPIWVVME